MPAIEVDQLSVAYGEFRAVNGVSLHVEFGEIVALLGPNGAGKTTTVEALEGYWRPVAGRVRVLGHDPRTEHGAVVAEIGAMLQEGGLYPTLSPERALHLFASYYPRPQDPRRLLERLGLGEVAGTPAKRLSGGERQRLALAVALVGRPRAVFLDEPTAGIDPAGRLTVRAVIEELRADGVAVLLTTHELPEAEHLADRVVILDRGEVIAAGSPDSLGGAQSIRFVPAGTLDLAALAEHLGAAVCEENGGTYRVAIAPTAAAIARLTGWLAEHDVTLVDLKAGAPSLEEVFLSLTGARRENLEASGGDARRRHGGRR